MRVYLHVAHKGRDPVRIVMFVLWALWALGYLFWEYNTRILCDNLGTRFISVEQARNSVIREDVGLHFPIDIVRGQQPQA